MTEVNYVQLQPSGFLTDTDFQGFTAEQRGIYTTIIFYLYANKGQMKDDIEEIKKLCNSKNENAIVKVLTKFKKSNGKLFHKRVSKELNKTRKLMQAKRAAGLKGAKKRWHSHKQSHSTPTVINNNNNSNNKVKEKVKKEKILSTLTLQNFIDSSPIVCLTEQQAKEAYEHYKQQDFVFGNKVPIPNPVSALQRWKSNMHKFKSGNSKKTKLFPIAGKTCCKCPLPAVYKDTKGAYDHYYCAGHMTEKVKETYE